MTGPITGPPPLARREEAEFNIWSIEHQAWWMPSWGGYTLDRTEAGVYTREEAINIVCDGTHYHPDDCDVLVTPLPREDY